MGKKEPVVTVKAEKRDRWSVTRDGTRNGAGLFERKADAVWYASKLAEKIAMRSASCLVCVQKPDGTYKKEMCGVDDAEAFGRGAACACADPFEGAIYACVDTEKSVKIPKKDIPF